MKRFSISMLLKQKRKQQGYLRKKKEKELSFKIKLRDLGKIKLIRDSMKKNSQSNKKRNSQNSGRLEMKNLQLQNNKKKKKSGREMLNYKVIIKDKSI